MEQFTVAYHRKTIIPISKICMNSITLCMHVIIAHKYTLQINKNKQYATYYRVASCF